MTRVLSVEDDADLQHLLSLGLTAAGFDVHYAFTGPEGYEKALALSPDVILCDMMLPGLNGADLIRKLKKHERVRSIPVIVMTAFSSEPGMLEDVVRPLGVVEYLRKPVRMEDLVRVIKRVAAGPGADRPPPIRKGGMALDEVQLSVWSDDRLVATLTRLRFALLRELARSQGPVDRRRLMTAVWGRTDCEAVLEKTVQRLREDLGPLAFRLRTTETGYELLG